MVYWQDVGEGVGVDKPGKITWRLQGHGKEFEFNPGGDGEK